MRSARRPLVLLLLGLLAAGLSGCGLLSTPTPTPTVQRRAASASPQVIAPKPASSPVVSSSAPGGPAPSLAAPDPQLKVPSLRLPTDGMQVVLVDSTDGEGVWIRRQPAGEPIRVWPEGSPMLVVGEDRFAEGRNWRHVQTLDGQTGWAAADFLSPTDPSALALAANSLSELAGGPRAQTARPAETEAQPAPTATPRTVARAAPKPGAALAGQLAAPSAPAPAAPSAAAAAAAAPPAAPAAASATPAPTATPQPTATPIRAPTGARSIEVGKTTMAVAGSERGLPIQIGNRPRAGMELLSVTVKVTNREATPFALYRGSFRLALSDRTRVEPLAGGESPLPYSASIEPGGELEGSLTFEVPTGTRVDGLIWAPERDVAYSLGI